MSTANGRSATRATAYGLPLSIDSSSASSSRSRSMRSASRHSKRPFSDGLTLAQTPSSKARRAAATARSTSALSPSGTLAITAPVAGLYTSNVLPEAALTILPSMSIFDERPRKFVAWRSRGSSSIVSIAFLPCWLAPALVRGRKPRQYRCIQSHIALPRHILGRYRSAKGTSHVRDRRHPPTS